MLSSEGLIHVNIYQSHGCYYLSGISTVVMYGKIDPSCYTEIRELPKGVVFSSPIHSQHVQQPKAVTLSW